MRVSEEERSVRDGVYKHVAVQKVSRTRTIHSIETHCVCVVLLLYWFFFKLYVFIILRARHDHNKIASCGVIKVFLNLNTSDFIFNTWEENYYYSATRATL